MAKKPDDTASPEEATPETPSAELVAPSAPSAPSESEETLTPEATPASSEGSTLVASAEETPVSASPKAEKPEKATPPEVTAESVPTETASETPAVVAAAPADKPATPEKKAAKPKGAKGAKKSDGKPVEAAKPVSFSLDDDIEQPKIVRAKGNKNVHRGVAHVQATFNNTIVSITDPAGAVIGWSSAGKCGFKGSRKSTAYAAQVVAQDACRQAMGHGLREVEVRVKGPGSGRESAVRAMQAVGLEITTIRDVTPVPHNGCRPPKQRRV